MTTIRFHGTKRQLLKKLSKIGRVVSGKSPSQAAKKMLTGIGETVLDLVSKAFIEKAAGGTDEAGLKWRPLSPKTVAYSRKHAGVPKGKARAKYAPSYALKEKQRIRWWSLYHRFLLKGSGKKGAAAGAWRVMKGEGAHTLLDLYGSKRVLILSDTGKLLNSLLPPTGGRRANQVFRVKRGSVEVGTSRKWAYVHHYGSAHVPQRRLWPSPRQWPRKWWTALAKEVTIGIGEIITEILR